jgi:ABC-type polysaccharide/polyol phosphate export permease
MNPMAGIIDSYRRTVLQGLPPDFLALGLAFLTSSLLLFVSWGYFRRAEQAFADVI